MSWTRITIGFVFHVVAAEERRLAEIKEQRQAEVCQIVAVDCTMKWTEWCLVPCGSG